MGYHLEDVLRAEAAAITGILPWVLDAYPSAIDLLTARAPIFSGMGKSGHIAAKAASTFRSLGIPAHYVHPSDASHGDLGALHDAAVLVLLSNSGNTPELSDMVLFGKEYGVPILAITGDALSPLASAAEVALCYGKVPEACPMGLAPTASTAAALALCDALAIDAAAHMGVTPEVFHRHHPGGKLGARLRRAKDIMRSPVPTVAPKSTLMDTALAMTGEISGIALVVNEEGRTEGVITDGDLRRAGELKFTQVAGEIVTRKFLTVPEHARVQEVADLMNKHRVTKILVEDALGAIIGVVNLHDCA